MVKPGAQLAAAASVLVSALDAFGQPSMVIGGIASIAHGVARLTRDIDVTVQGEGTELDALAATLKEHGIVPRIDDAIEFARRHQVRSCVTVPPMWTSISAWPGSRSSWSPLLLPRQSSFRA